MTQTDKPHEFTQDGKVLILRCCDENGRSYGGFQWPELGESVEPDEWIADEQCGNGLHGWPWGTAFGDGKYPIYNGVWIVFSAKPEDIVDLGGKCKAKRGVVEFRGNYQEALSYVLPGYHAWALAASSGASSATGPSGASSATGDSGASSATGYSGASSATGDRGASSATGYKGASSATGDKGASSATGDKGAAIITGEYATIEVGATALGCVTSHRWEWVARKGSVVCCRVNNGPGVLFAGDDYEDGELVKVEFGEVVEDWDYDK